MRARYGATTMTKRIFLTALATLALTTAAQAQDADFPTLESMGITGAGGGMDAIEAPQFYAQFLGGGALADSVTFYDASGTATADEPLSENWAVAGVLGFGLGTEGLSAELDVFATQRDYSVVADEYRTTFISAMGVLRYEAAITDAISLYGGAGLGVIYLNDTDLTVGTDYINAVEAGYLLKAGVELNVSENLGLLAEVRHANSFRPFPYLDGSGFSETAPATAIMAGISLSF